MHANGQDADDGDERNADDRQADGNLDHGKTGLAVPDSYAVRSPQSAVPSPQSPSRWDSGDSGLWGLWTGLGFSLQLLIFQNGAARQPVNVNNVVRGVGAVAGWILRHVGRIELINFGARIRRINHAALRRSGCIRPRRFDGIFQRQDVLAVVRR